MHDQVGGIADRGLTLSSRLIIAPRTVPTINCGSSSESPIHASTAHQAQSLLRALYRALPG
jgi:hypothetical protein